MPKVSSNIELSFGIYSPNLTIILLYSFNISISFNNSLSLYLHPRVLLSGNYVINIITFDLDDQFYEEYGKFNK